jgi:hypothetical protein
MRSFISPLKLMLILTIGLGSTLFYPELSPSQAIAQTPLMTVEELINRKTEWRSLKEPFKVEGRVQAMAGDGITFTMLNRDILFKFASRDLKPAQTPSNAEVTGTLRFISSDYVFTITSIRELPADYKQTQQKASQLKATDAEGYYELGNQAHLRASFYNDTELEQLSGELLLKGVEIAHDQIAMGDTDKLIALAGKVEQLGLSQRLADAYRFEAMYQFWNTTKDKVDFNAIGYLERLKVVLPASQYPLTKPPGELLNSFTKNAVKSYHDASEPDRFIFQRLLYREVAMKYIESQQQANGSNAGQLVEMTRKMLPEESKLMNTMQLKDLDYRTTGISTATRSEALAVAEGYQKFNIPDKAQNVLEEWMKYHQARIPADRLVDRIALADDYVALLNQPEKAKEELVSILKLYPQEKAVTDRLTKLGYQQKNGEWVSKMNPTPATGSKAQNKAQFLAGGIATGMNREEVFKELGAPTAITRVMTQDGINEAWAYSDARLSITFAAKASSSDITVQEVISTVPVSQVE